MSAWDSPPEGLRENVEVLQVGNDMLYPDPERGERAVGFPGCCREIRSALFFDRGNKSRPGCDGLRSLVAGISKNCSVGRYPGEDGVILQKFLVMAFSLHGFGNC